jgi:hypothetical protein
LISFFLFWEEARFVSELKDPSLGFQGFVLWVKGVDFLVAKKSAAKAKMLKCKKMCKKMFLFTDC